VKPGQFVKGDARIHRTGRPLGSKDKKWTSLDYWFGLVEAEWGKIEPKDRVHVAIDAWKALLARKQYPLTPEESVQNADSAMKLLKVLEDASRNAELKRNSGSDSIRVAIGETGLQTPEAPTQRI